MRTTKQISCFKNLTSAERFNYLKLLMLHYRRIRGDMIMAFKNLTGVIDSTASCNFIYSHKVTRVNRHKLTQKHVH